MPLHYRQLNVIKYYYGIIYEYHVSDTSCDQLINKFGYYVCQVMVKLELEKPCI